MSTIEQRLSLPAAPGRLQRLRTWLPALAFLGGFAWDAVTLGREIKPFDLVLLFGYFIAAGILLVLIGRGFGQQAGESGVSRFHYSRYLNLALQFFFGGIFSALVIFYFLSSSDLPGLLFVAGLLAMLVANEFLESAYGRMTLSWAFFCLAGTMLLNFALPHLFGSISPFWFYLSTLLALLLVLALRQITRLGFTSVLPPVGVAALLLLLYLLNLIPPVPLVQKEMVIAHALEKRGGRYEMTVEPAPIWKPWLGFSRTFHRSEGERIYCFTSVFVPSGIETTMRHEWLRRDPHSGEWKSMGIVPFEIRGGRKDGYRGYTYKSNAAAGEWKVVARSEHGAAIGVVEFEVVAGERRKEERRVY